MKRLLLGIFSLLPGILAAQETADPIGESPAGAEAAPKDSYEGKVVTIEIRKKSLMDLRKYRDWEQVLKRAGEEKARAVVLRIKASGGYITQTEKLMQEIASAEVPTYALVEGQALDAGAMVAISAQTIYMTPGAMIGGAGIPKGGDAETKAGREKAESLMLAKIRSVVGKQGHNLAVIQAMMASSEEEKSFGEIVVPKGTVLTLTASEAASQVEGQALLARGVVDDLDGLLEKEGLTGAEVVEGTPNKPKGKSLIIAPGDRAGVAGGEDKKDKKEETGLIGKVKEESFEGKVVILKVGRDDLMNKQSFKFWRRMLRRAEEENARAIIFDLDTPGGYAYETKEIMSEITRLKVPCFAFVNENALSAGALISVATDGIYMSPEGTIGAAGLVSGSGAEIEDMMRKKLHSAFEAQIRSVAEKKGHDPELIRAMMIPEDEDRVFGDVVVKAGELLTLTSTEATSLRDGEPLLARGVVTSLEEIVAAEGLGGAEIVRAEATPFERFAWWVAKWSFLLILIGMGAAYAEMKAPGFGVGGAISLAAFGTFFFGNYVAGNLPGYEWVALFVLGILLIIAEIFIIPGTGITGIAGTLCVVVSLMFGMVDRIDFGDWKGGEFDGGLLDVLRGPVLSLAAGLIGGSILIVILMRFLPDVPIFRALMVKKELAGGASLPGDVGGHENRVGWTGETLTDLRPAGKGCFSEAELDIVADGAFISKGTKVRIVEEDGMRIVVTQIEGV